MTTSNALQSICYRLIQIFLLSGLAMNTGCGQSDRSEEVEPPVNKYFYYSKIKVKSVKDAKIPHYEVTGDTLLLKHPDGAKGHFNLEAVKSMETDEEVIYFFVYFETYDDDHFVLKSATDNNGTVFEVSTEKTSEYAGTKQDFCSVFVTREYLQEHKEEGVLIEMKGARKTGFLEAPGIYIQAFVDRLGEL